MLMDFFFSIMKIMFLGMAICARCTVRYGGSRGRLPSVGFWRWRVYIRTVRSGPAGVTYHKKMRVTYIYINSAKKKLKNEMNEKNKIIINFFPVFLYLYMNVESSPLIKTWLNQAKRSIVAMVVFVKLKKLIVLNFFLTSQKKISLRDFNWRQNIIK